MLAKRLLPLVCQVQHRLRLRLKSKTARRRLRNRTVDLKLFRAASQGSRLNRQALNALARQIQSEKLATRQFENVCSTLREAMALLAKNQQLVRRERLPKLQPVVSLLQTRS